MKVAVTGGSGQLGTQLLRRLIAKRRIKKVVSLDVVPPMVSAAKLDWQIADVRDPGLDRHFEGADVLVHLAFIVTRPSSPDEMEAVNVRGSKNVFDSAAKAGVKRIVYASSVAAYGMAPGHPEPIVESTPRRRVTALPYSRNKFDVEEYLDEFEPAHPDIGVVRMRPVVLIGERLEHGFGSIVRRGLLPEVDDVPLPIVWDEDVADAFMLAIQGDARGAFNLSAADLLPVAELAERTGLRRLKVPERVFEGLLKMKPLIRRLGIDPSWAAARGVRIVPSSERALSELGWKPTCPTAVDVMRRYRQRAPHKLDRRIAVFMKMVGSLAKKLPDSKIPSEARRIDVRVHLELTGPGGGDFDLNVEGGRLHLQRGVPRPPDGTVTIAADTFLEMLAGAVDTSTMHFTGKIRVRGEPMSGMVVDGMITSFRKATKAEGARGWPARKLSAWFESAATA